VYTKNTTLPVNKVFFHSMEELCLEWNIEDAGQ